jgi:hypothetical protein
MGGAWCSERSGKARNKLDRIQKCLRAAENVLFLFFTLDVIFKDYHEPY